MTIKKFNIPLFISLLFTLQGYLLSAQNSSPSSLESIESLDLDNLTKEDCYYLDSCLTVNQEALNDIDKIKYYNALSSNLLDYGVPLLAISYITPLIHLLEKSDNKEELAQLYSNKSLAHDYLGQYPQALTASQKSLELYIELGDKEGEAYSYNDIGILHYYDGNDSLSGVYHERSFVIFKALNDTVGMALYYNNMANTLYEMEEYPNAIMMYTKAREFNVILNDKSGEAIALSNIGEVYVLIGDYDKAETILLESLEIAEETNDPWNITNPLRGLGELYRLTNRIPEAIEVLERSVDLSIEIDAIAEQAESYKLLYKLHKSTRNYKLSLNYLEKYKAANDSIFNQAKVLMTSEMEMKYQIKDKAKKIELLNSNKVIDDLEYEKQISQQKNKVIYLVGGLIGFSIMLLFVARGFLLKKKANYKLKEQNSIIQNKNEVINQAYLQIEEKNKEILDSIRYAKRIQSAILPSKSQMKTLLPENFVFYRPKDVVAGDFYWLEEKDNKILFATADCTGHGVPGAMVSVVCHNALKRTVREYGLTDPGEILNKTRDIVVEEFAKADEDVKDGMDIALCALQNNTLEYAGAHNPLWLIRTDTTEIEEIKADKQPIGLFDNPQPYTTHKINLNPGDLIYIFSDGFADQFGGEKGKKFKTANFKRLLLSIQTQSMNEQLKLIHNAFETWKGDIEQLDDVCVIGIRV